MWLLSGRDQLTEWASFIAGTCEQTRHLINTDETQTALHCRLGTRWNVPHTGGVGGLNTVVGSSGAAERGQAPGHAVPLSSTRVTRGCAKRRRRMTAANNKNRPWLATKRLFQCSDSRGYMRSVKLTAVTCANHVLSDKQWHVTMSFYHYYLQQIW